MSQLWIGKKKMTKVKLNQKVSKTLPKIGKNHALKRNDQLTLNASCFTRNITSNIYYSVFNLMRFLTTSDNTMVIRLGF